MLGAARPGRAAAGTWDGRRRRVRWFAPTRDLATGSLTLGMVPHARTDPVRGALIAIAPLLLIPPLLTAIVFLLAGTTDLEQLRHALSGLATWRLALLAYLGFSCSQAAFRLAAITSAFQAVRRSPRLLESPSS